MEYDLPALRNLLVKSYNLSELQDLCFNLHVDDEILGGTNKPDKARELLSYLDRRDRILELIQVCQRERPNREWNLVLSEQDQGEAFREKLGLDRTIRSRYLDEQFLAYQKAWQSLYQLKQAGDELWKHVSKENIANFAALLRQAQELVGMSAPLFSQPDYEALGRILDQFGQFEAGKVRMFQITSTAHEGDIYPDEARARIKANRQVKAEYEALLDRILRNFRGRIQQLT